MLLRLAIDVVTDQGVPTVKPHYNMLLSSKILKMETSSDHVMRGLEWNLTCILLILYHASL